MGDVRWWLLYALTWAVLYGAFVARLDGALYVTTFCAWFVALMSPLMLVDSVIEQSVQEPPTPVRDVLLQLRNWVMLGGLVWFGYIDTGVAWGLAMLCHAAHRLAVRRKRAAAADQPVHRGER